MPFPLVPRSTYDAAISQRDERIAELKARLAKVEEALTIEHERMTDLMACRAIGQSMYGRITPPKEAEEPEEPVKPASNDPATERLLTPLESDIAEVGTNARALARRAQGRSQAEIDEAERAVELARQVGRERAVVGNGNH